MPLLIYQSNFNNSSRLLVWKATESREGLMALVKWNPDLEAQFGKIRLEKRQREWLSSRILIQLVLPEAKLYFAPTGKPMLEGKMNISISHCGDLAGIVISESNVGLDIQGVDEKLEKIAARYCHPLELKQAHTQSEYLEYITIIWSAKEAVFKYFGELVTFNEDILIRPFQIHQEELTCDYKGVHGSHIFTLQHVELKGYHIVMTVSVD